MNIIRKEESREQCMEAGWYAYDYELEQDMTRNIILKLRELGGSFVYLTSLKRPFYKLENQYYMIKGTEGKNYLRVSMYREYEDEICRKVEGFLEGIS